MVIVSMNMGNLTLEVNTLKIRLVIREKAMLQEELGKEKKIKRDINITWKFGGRVGERLNKRLKCSLKNCRMRMRSSKVARTLMRMTNKMKDFEVEYEEWWEVVEEYFSKELETNLAQ
jgi:hypothetical protein